MTATPPRKRGHKLRWTFIVLGVLVVGALLDLYAPVRADLRDFDPRALARLDTAMWRAFDAKKPIPLFFDLARLMREQFHFPFLRSFVGAFHAAHAGLTFRRSHGAGDYEEVLPDLRAYFGGSRKISKTGFDAYRTAELELQWWVIHRERGLEDQDLLARTIAMAAAELYRVPAESL